MLCQVFVNSCVRAQLCHLGEGVLNEKQVLNQYLFNGTGHLWEYVNVCVQVSKGWVSVCASSRV